MLNSRIMKTRTEIMRYGRKVHEVEKLYDEGKTFVEAAFELDMDSHETKEIYDFIKKRGELVTESN